MWYKLFLNIMISIFLIYSFHQLWDYLKTAYSKQTTKDLIQFQTEKYKKIIEQIQTVEPSHTNPEKDPMKDELEDFVNNLQQNGQSV